MDEFGIFVYLLGSEQAAGAADARPCNDGARGKAEVLHHVNGDTRARPAQACAMYTCFEFEYIRILTHLHKIMTDAC